MKIIPDDMKALLLANWERGDPDCAPLLRLLRENGRTFALVNTMNGDDHETVYGLFEFQSGKAVLGRESLETLDVEIAADRFRVHYIPTGERNWPLSAYCFAARHAKQIVDDADALNQAETKLKQNPGERLQHQFRAISVQCVYPAYYEQVVSVLADAIDDGLDHAIEFADSRDSWKSCDDCGLTFITAAAVGLDTDPWLAGEKRLAVPSQFTERGSPPTAIVTIRGGVAQSVDFDGRPCRVIVRDYDCDAVEGLGAIEHNEDEAGNPYTESIWGP